MLDTNGNQVETKSVTHESSRPAAERVKRFFTKEGTNPYDLIDWERRDILIKDHKTGKVVFQQNGVEVPVSWSHNAATIVASKYFRGHGAERESSVRQLIDRVVRSIGDAAFSHRYMDKKSAMAFEDELRFLCVNQMMAFNSPVWFNAGATDEPQCSACFILDVEDDMKSILNWVTEEGLVFRRGSGAGVNISKLREKNAKLSGGGHASGPLSFAMSADRSAGAIKSGGTTRRAAKMLVMNVDHPDIEDFVDTKVHGEKVARALIAAGFSPDFNAEGGAYELAPWQNANNSVRVTDDFMKAVETGAPYALVSRVDGSVVRYVNAKDLWNKIAAAAWGCGDPGIQFHDTVNKWHTCPVDGEIEASNPCCFVGETLVDTSEGRISIAELAAMTARGDALPFAFSHDLDTGLPVLRQIKKGWKAGETKRLVRVKTDKGVEVLCTPEHRFLTYGGEYVEAKDLTPGTRLRKVARWKNDQRSGRHCLNMNATTENPSGSVWQSRFMWEQVNGMIPEGMHVHHCNEDPTDDRLSNFELVEARSHISEHSTGNANPRFLNVAPSTLVDVWDTIEKTPRVTHLSQPPVTPARWNAYVQKAGLSGLVPKAASPTRGGLVQGMPWAEFTTWIDEQRAAANDRVSSVEHVSLEEPVAVYDIEVDGVHNFAVSAGDTVHSLVVHNSEYMFLNNTACNLASLNLMRFRRADGSFDTESFVHAVETTILAQEVIVSMSSYPTEMITDQAKKYRTLGIGFANLGALLMSMGLAYDSAAGRDLAGAITSLMTAVSYRVSGEVAKTVGTFTGFFRNQNDVAKVLQQHAAEHDLHTATSAFNDVCMVAAQNWSQAVQYARTTGLRNAQASVLAPTGTISFMMDCDTTGIEPDLALVKYKKLVGGGSIKIVNQTVKQALAKLDYLPGQVADIVSFIETNDTIEGAPHIKSEHLSVFDCSLVPAKGTRSITPNGHIDMMAACQPFLSGAISKTVNMPRESTIEDITAVYMDAWKKGLKAIAIYRDGCKESQPLNVKDDSKATVSPAGVPAAPEAPAELPKRERLPDDRMAGVHKFSIGGHDGYLTLGYYKDGRLGEVFVNMAKQGSTLNGLMDAWATMVSLGIQYGMPIETIVEKFKHTTFEPSGFTSNPDVRMTSSLLDYVVRVVEQRAVVQTTGGLLTTPVKKEEEPKVAALADEKKLVTGPPCTQCGAMTVRSGACYCCKQCGNTTGCG